MTRAIALFTVFFASAAITVAQSTTTQVALLPAQYKLSRLAAGQTSGEVTFSMDQSQNVTIEIIAGVSDLMTSIAGPVGQIIDQTTVESLGGTFTVIHGDVPDGGFMLSSLSPGYHYIYSFPWQGVGIYTVRFQVALPLARDLAIITQSLTDSNIGATLLSTEPKIVLGNTAVLTAVIFDGTAPVGNATVEVNILPASGAPIALTLRDNGTQSDNAAGDGLYSGEFVPSTIGKYSASARISGVSGGLSFARQAATTFTVVSPSSKLVGSVTDQGIDDDGDGRFNSVAIDVSTNTTQAGKYRAFVHLKTKNGQQFFRSGEATLASGIGAIRVSFEASVFLQLGENGPYTIELIELLSIVSSGANPSDSLANVGQTKAYLLTQFQRPDLALTGVITDQAIDDNGNGKFDRLVVAVQVNALKSGSYSWTYKLSDTNSDEIDFKSGSGLFNVGLNNLSLTFSGAKIGAFGVDGPYALRDLLLQGASSSLVVSDIGPTKTYLFTQFEGAFTKDISPTIALVRSGLVYDRRIQRFVQQVTLQNIGSTSVSGPIYLVLDSLSANASLTNKTGVVSTFAPLGGPYIIALPSGGTISAGSAASITLQFSNSTSAGFTYTTRVLAGPTGP